MCWRATQGNAVAGRYHSRTAKWWRDPLPHFPSCPVSSGGSWETSPDLILLFPFIYFALKTMHNTGLLGQLSHSGGNTFAYQKQHNLLERTVHFLHFSSPSLLSRLEKHCFRLVSFTALLVRLLGVSRSVQQRSVSPSEEEIFLQLK